VIAVADDEDSHGRAAGGDRIKRAIARPQRQQRCGNEDNRERGNRPEKAPSPAPRHITKP
jgi:hypothetical protein